MLYASFESGIFSRQSLPSRRSGGHGSGLSAIQTPDRSGWPSAARGAGAFRSTAPDARRGTPGVRMRNHWAAAGADSTKRAAETAAIRFMERHVTQERRPLV